VALRRFREGAKGDERGEMGLLIGTVWRRNGKRIKGN
jgi:hypothetical protein